MTFAEKLVFLMKLTATSNKQLADAVKVDPSLISLLRTARRSAPKNTTHIRAMAVYFARKCEGNYQRIALSEALGRKHLQIQMGTEQLSQILYDWLTDSRDQVGQFLNTFERFPLAEPDVREESPLLDLTQKNDPSIFAYYGNEGKRGAVSAFISYLLSLDAAGTILLSTDESLEWLFEAPEYLAQLQERITLLLNKGFRICRIATPLSTAEQAFDSLTRWLPLYMTGQVESLYYPRLRDNLYHRTLVVLPGVAAVFASSVGDQPISRAVMFTLDRRLTDALAGEFRDMLAKCRPMMTTYSTVGNAEELLRCIAQFESDKGNRIQQSTSLSSITAPPALIRLAAEGTPEHEAASIVEALARAQDAFRQSLAKYEVIDIHSLAEPADVRAGQVPISVAYLRQEAPLCYTPETYALHLQEIVDYMERYENYRAVLLPRGERTHALMVKDGRQAMLLRPGTPLTVFEVSQPYIAEACREYLMQLIETPFSPSVRRQDTVSRLRHMIQELRRE